VAAHPTTEAAEFMQVCAQEGTAEATGAQFGATVIVLQEDDPPAGGVAVVGAPVGGVENDTGALLNELLAALVEGFGSAVVIEDPPPPPPQDVVVAAGPFAQTQTALAEASTAPAELAPHAESTHGAAVAWIAAD
jgi:hypothetical protein